MKKWFVTIGVVIVFASLAATAVWWAPWLLDFAGANSDAIQGLTGLLQMILWAAAGIALIGGLWRVRPAARAANDVQTSAHTGTAHKGAAIAQDHSVAAGPAGVAVGNDAEQVSIGPTDRLVKADIYIEHLEQTKVVTSSPSAPSAPPAPSKEVQAEAFQLYLRRLIHRCNELPLAALGGEASAAEEVTLDQVYVDLDTTTQITLTAAEQEQRKKAGAGLAGDAEHRPITALEAATQTRKLVLLGDPGSGKSTFVHHLAAWLAEADLGLRPPPAGWPATLAPVVTVLRDVAGAIAAAHDAALADKAQRVAFVQVLVAHWQSRLQKEGAGDAWPALQRELEQGAGAARLRRSGGSAAAGSVTYDQWQPACQMTH